MSREIDKAIEEGRYTVLRDLSPKEIEWHDSLRILDMAEERAFHVAFNYYMNKVSDSREKLEQFYESLSGIDRHDPARGTMAVTWVQGRVALVKIEEA